MGSIPTAQEIIDAWGRPDEIDHRGTVARTVADLARRSMERWQRGADAVKDKASVEKRSLQASEQRVVDIYEKQADELATLLSELEPVVEAEKEAEANRAQYDDLRIGSGRVEESNRRTAPAFINGAWGKASEDERNLRDFLRGRAGDDITIPLGDFGVELDFRTKAPTVVEYRDLTTVNASGTFSTAFRRQLYEHIVHNSAILSAGPMVIPTPDGRDLKLPKTTADGVAAIVGAGSALPESDPTFSSTTLSSWKVGIYSEIDNELVSDSEISIVPAVLRLMGRSIGNVAGGYWVTGTGSNEPTGLFTVAGTALTGGTAQSGVPTADELYDIVHSVHPDYRRQPNVGWLMSDATWKSLSRLKDDQSRYLIGDLAGGAPPRLLGYPVFVDPNVPNAGTAVNSVAFGDMQAFAIRLTELRLERSSDHKFQNDQTAVRGIVRTDSDLLDLTGAIKLYRGGAS